MNSSCVCGSQKSYIISLAHIHFSNLLSILAYFLFYHCPVAPSPGKQVLQSCLSLEAPIFP